MFKIVKDDSNRLRAISTNRVANIISTGTATSFPISQPTVRPQSIPPVQIDSGELSGDIPATLIDVVEGFDWKVSPNFSQTEYPFIMLKEYRLNKSVLLSQLASNIQTIFEGLINQGALVAGEIPTFGILSDILSSILPGENPESEEVIADIANFLTTAGLDAFSDVEEYLLPYLLLYFTEKTDFNYKLPYFTKNAIKKNMSWNSNFSDSNQTGAAGVGEFVETSNDFVASQGLGIDFINGLVEKGQYVERGKYFNPTESRPFSFSFPLLNTISAESTQQNFNLIWLLCFQNCVVRSGIADIDPPCMYEVIVPGWKYIKYGVIQTISIEHLGNRRRIPIIHPASETEVNVIIPEAYNVNLTITSLTPDSSNFMLKSLEPL
jgi:hypothetical protein